ncbi:hypothetical protein NCAS_0H00450 [Naumovozyma castellii]|uniref:Kinetochore-associated protein n=1 Tax=Naumovozyma castellii TaxID=27288 RepID=G0VIN0_NAUCA|nr:hypothetical protein NCAS_0H00450 [Naumovozyma castellii CBS 4309]CCC71355.1 hypothetical protein NCAS_0H00450 [Naumovozyma castellii CBS 4309]
MTKAQKIRYIRLNQVFNKALNQSISNLSKWDKISSCFPEYASHQEGATNLMNCQTQVIEFWKELCKREFEEIVKERNVKAKLDELDDLILESQERLNELNHEKGKNEVNVNDELNINIDDLTPEQLINCNLFSQRKQATKDLNERLARLNDINNNLANELTDLQNSIGKEYDEIRVLYDEHLGKPANQTPDATLVQGLNDMLVELQES